MSAAEIELLERVLFRLGTADTDAALESTVCKFLAPVLLKITSPEEAVRCKVMEILTHVNKRLKSRPAVQLPVEALLDQYHDSQSSFLHNFAIIYVTMGFPRLSVEQQTELVPKLLNCLESKPLVHQDKMFMLVLPLLGAIKIPDDPAQRHQLLGLADKPTTKLRLLALIQDVLLLPYGVTGEADVPGGFSAPTFKRVIANGWSAEQLEQLKKGLCRFICAGVLPDRDAFALLVLASADTRFSVATPAIAELNKLNSSLDWTDPVLSAPLYTLFLGTTCRQTGMKTLPCSPRVRQKLLAFLQRTRGAAIHTARAIQLIFEAVFGEGSSQKGKVLALQFTELVVKEGQRDVIATTARVILGGVSKLIGAESPEPYDVQAAAYNVIAQLARTCPAVMNRDLMLVAKYFEHLAVAPSELQTSLREALVALAPAFSWRFGEATAAEAAADATSATGGADFVPNANQKLLLAMLAQHVESKLLIMQNVASVYLTTCYPDHYGPSRYLLLLLLAGERSTLTEAVLSYLYGVSKKDHINWAFISTVSCAATEKPAKEKQASDLVNQLSTEQRRIVLPDFAAICTHIFEESAKRDAGATEKHLYGRVKLSYTYEAYTEILEYLRLCLWFSAGAKGAPGDPKNAQLLAAYWRASSQTAEGKLVEERYLHLVKRILQAKRGRAELSCLYDLLDVEPARVAPLCFDLLDGFDAGLKDVSDGTRSLVAQVQGIILAYGCDAAEHERRMKDMLANLAQKSLEHRHGCILAGAHAFQRSIRRVQGQSAAVVGESETLKSFTTMLVKMLDQQQPLLVSVGIKSLSLIGAVSPLPFADDQPEAASAEDGMDVDQAAELSKRSVSERIFRLLKSVHTKAKTREEAAICLGYLAIGDGAYFVPSNLRQFITLLKLTKETALNIAIAQGIVYTMLGHEDHIVPGATSSSSSSICTDEMLTNFLNAVIAVVPDPNPESRNATAIWLLAIVKNLSSRPAIYQRKQLLQFAFTELLSDDSDFVQDVASRGLGLVFGLSDPNAQTDLANSLLDQLIGGRRQVNQVTEDTQIFEEGVLGKTPMGGNITTYKELCSLASDLNQPEMIYQFMQLANHNAAWNSKLGAAFGLQSISASARAQMQPYLGKIVPRLYRYKYDPTPKIQNSMCSIWDSVVSEPKETVELYYWEIFDELCENLTQVEWRVRIACCLAVRDLIRRPTGLRLRCDDRAREVLRATAAAAALTAKSTGTEHDMDIDVAVNAMDIAAKAPLPTDGATGTATPAATPAAAISEPELQRLWSQLFRVMDDVHEGTRLAAEGTAKILAKQCVIAAGSDSGKSGQSLAASILPLILDTGVTHMVPEIRALSMRTLSELIDSSGDSLRPHLPTLVPCLLRATGELEVPKLSYLSTRLGAQADAQEAVDSIRAEAAKQHHSMETLTKCVRHIDYAALERMAPEICELMRNTVNLGTKIACAHFLCLITLRFDREMQPIVGKFLGAALNGLKDRNGVVRKYNASAIGHLLGVAKEQSVVRMFVKLSELYFESPANRGVPQTLISINKRHQDVLKDHSAHVLPLIFFAMHEEIGEENADCVELWKELWVDVSPGDAGIRMNLESLVPTLERRLQDPSWLMKAQAASAINTLAKRLKDQLPAGDRQRLIETLLEGLSGRTFQGKERLLQALASLSKDLKRDDTAALIDAVMRECRKEEPLYRTHALRAIGDILEQLQVDRFEEVYNMIWYLMERQNLAAVTGDDDDKQLSASERNKRALIFVNLKEVVCETLGKAWPTVKSPETQRKYQVQFAERCVQCLQTNTRPVQLSLLVALGKFLDRLECLEAAAPTTTATTGTTAAATPEEDGRRKKARVEPDDQLEKICKDVLSAVVYVSDISHVGLKKEALSIVLILTKRLIDNSFATELQLLRRTFAQVQSKLQRDTAPEIKCRLKDIEDKLKLAQLATDSPQSAVK